MTSEEMRKHNLEILRKQGMLPAASGGTAGPTMYQQALTGATRDYSDQGRPAVYGGQTGAASSASTDWNTALAGYPKGDSSGWVNNGEQMQRYMATNQVAGPTTQRGVQGAVTQGAAGPTTQQTPYQQALDAYTPQRYTFWNGGKTNDGWKIDNSQSAMWQQIKSMYDSGDVTGAMNLVNELSGKGLFGGYYDENGNYTGFVQGYTGSANASMQPVVGGKLLSSGKTDTNIWLTPDGKALNGTTGGALTDNGSTWSRYAPNQGTGWSWTDVQNENGLGWGDTFAIRAAHGDFTNPALNTPEGNARKLETMYEKPGGFTDEEWAKKIAGYDPDYIAELAKYSGSSSGSSSGGATGGSSGSVGGSYPSGTTPYMDALNMPAAYDPNSDPLFQDYLAKWQNANAPEYAGDPYQAQRDAALAAYGEKWQGSPYQQLRDEYLQNAANMKWDYDPNSDPVWQALQKQYRREGRRATEDTLGKYAAMTGGMPSTAAVTAASQAGDYYAAQLSDRLPQVYQDAYNRYLQEYQRQLGISDAYAGFDDREYSRWRDQQGKNLDLANAYNQYGQRDYNEYLNALDQWNRDRSFAYGAARDNQQMGRQQVEDQYGRYRDAIADQRWDAQWAQTLREYADSQNWKATEWAQYLREYGDKLSQQEREWAYQQLRDAVNDSRYADETAYSRALEQAQLGAKYGDMSGLGDLGIDTSKATSYEYAYAPDGSTYKFSTDMANKFVKNAPNNTQMRGGDGSIWKKDEYGNVTITDRNGKVYKYGEQYTPQEQTPQYTPKAPKTPSVDEEPETPETPEFKWGNRIDGNYMYVGGKKYTLEEIEDGINSNPPKFKYTFNEKTNTYTVSPANWG